MTAKRAKLAKPPGDYRRLHLAVALIGFVACGIASVWMGQDNSWDLRNYHYYNAYAFLHNRVGFDVALAQRQSYLNPLADVPFYLGANHLNPRVFGFLLGGLQGLSVWLVFATSFIVFRNLGRHRVSLSVLCAAVGAYAPVFVGELGASPNDTLLSLLVLFSVWLFTRQLAREGTLDGARGRRTLMAGAAALGMAMGLKLTLTVHVLAAGAAILAMERSWRSSARVLGFFALCVLAGFLVTNGYWMARMWHEFQNPLFPFYNHIFKSPWAETRSFADQSMIPGSLLQALVVPIIFCWENPYTIVQGQFHDARYAVLYLLMIALGVRWLVHAMRARLSASRSVKSDSGSDTGFILVFFVISFLLWESKFNIIRYTASLEALAPLLIVLGVRALSHHRVVRVAVTAAAFVLIVIIMRPFTLERVSWGEKFFDVRVPPINDTQSCLILVANDRPLSYLATMFPPEARWIGLNNNLTTPDRSTKMQEEIRRLIDTNRTIYLLTRIGIRGWILYDEHVLALYGLAPEENAGTPVVSRYTRAGMELVPLRRVEAGYVPPHPMPDRPPRD